MSSHRIVTDNQPLPPLYVQQDESAGRLVCYVNTQQWLFHPLEGFIVCEGKGSLSSVIHTKRAMTESEAVRFLDKIEDQVNQEPRNRLLGDLYKHAISWYYADIVAR